jgi:hypothetical protein
MKIQTAFTNFAILALSFICLRSGAATTGKLPLSDKQISSAKAMPSRFLSYFGGSDTDDCDDIAVDAAGHIYLACHSTSNDFPGSQKRDNSQDADRMDAYVSKIDPAAGKVLYTIRLGGSKWDGTTRIEVDQYNNAYVAGFTESSDFPSSYIGGNDRDILEGTAPAPGGGAWATGLTGSRNLQTIGSLQKAHNGGLFDAMFIKIPVPRRKSAPR